jgi:hypothetical protein
MASPAYQDAQRVPSPEEPRANRACLTPTMVAEFDREWVMAMKQAKHDHDLPGVHSLLVKWHHIAYAEGAGGS